MFAPMCTCRSLSLDDPEDQSKGAAGVSSLSEGMEELDLHTEPGKERYLPKSGVLSFLLPGLCHLTAETRPRTILMQAQVHQVLARCLQLHLSSFLSTKAHQSEMALRTLCGIFLNLLVLSPEQVTSDPTVAGLLHRIMGAVPQLGCPEHTVLLANFVVLCLMQARHVTDLQETEVTRQFFSTAVEFLGGAYHVTRGGEQQHLSVSPAYTPHWDSISELWFLGMQALVSCIPQLPWLPGIFLETGLLKNVVALLQDIPGNICVETGLLKNVVALLQDIPGNICVETGLLKNVVALLQDIPGNICVETGLLKNVVALLQDIPGKVCVETGLLKNVVALLQDIPGKVCVETGLLKNVVALLQDIPGNVCVETGLLKNVVALLQDIPGNVCVETGLLKNVVALLQDIPGNICVETGLLKNVVALLQDIPGKVCVETGLLKNVVALLQDIPGNICVETGLLKNVVALLQDIPGKVCVETGLLKNVVALLQDIPGNVCVETGLLKNVVALLQDIPGRLHRAMCQSDF
ncbi:uncharacterized protein LOC144877435 [Branchiostoma floridae x Branchiostoma japonicum]